MNTTGYYALQLISVTIAAFSQILLKKSAMKTYPYWLREYLNPHVIIGYGMLAVSTVFTTLAYTGLDYKNVPILESVGYVLVMFLSLLFFGEKITKKKALGTIVILAGVIVFNL